jgi:hypothetical protein
MERAQFTQELSAGHFCGLFEGFIRYQRILSTGQLYTISSQMAFDDSVGINYTQLLNWRVGLYWYGQLHVYGYESYDPSVSEFVTGEQTLFFSNIELRFAYEF